MKHLKYILLVLILFPLIGIVASCSEDSSEESDFDNWQTKNETALSSWSTNSSYRKIVTYSKNESAINLKANDYIYVEVLESGEGTESPLFTDTCRVAYRGSYIPTISYPDGLVFDQTWIGDFSWETAGTSTFAASSLVDGVTTALMHMHVGDRWRVRIPYSLGYGTSDYTTGLSTIAGYSNLVFDIALYDMWHPGDYHFNFKTR